MRSDGRLFWVRATWLLDRLSRGIRTTAGEVANHFGVSCATVYRIFDSLRDDFGAPLEFNRATGSWLLSDPHWEFPRLPLTPGEVTALAFARGLVTQVTAPGIADDMRRFWDKLSMELSAQSPDGAAFAESITALAPRWSSPSSDVMDRVLRGLALGRRLELDYQSPWSGKRRLRTVEPRHLILYEGSFYLAAHCLLREGALRLFHLCATRSARLTDQPVSSRPFSLDDVVDAYGLMLGTDLTELTLRISPPAAHRAAFEVWHPSQRDEIAPDGTLTRTFPTRGFAEVQRLVLSFGSAAEVISPPELRDRLRDEVFAMAARFAGPPTSPPTNHQSSLTMLKSQDVPLSERDSCMHRHLEHRRDGTE